MNFLELKNQLLDIFEKKFKILYDRIDLIAENFDNFRNQELSRDNNIEKRLKTLIEKKIKEIKLKTDSNLKKINIVYEDLSKKIKDDYQQLKDEIYDKIIKDDYSKEIENIKFEISKIKNDIKEINESLNEIKTIFE
jgi:gas vesicle protein